MAEVETLRGAQLYAALMALKPDGLAETEWATKAGVNRGFFSNLKSSDIIPRSDTLRKILAAVGRGETDLYRTGGTKSIQVHYIDAFENDAAPIIKVPGDGEVVQIQKLDLSLSMGPGTLIDDWVESEPVNFDLSFIRALTRTPPQCLKLVGGIGDSMYPTLNWGDLIMIDTTTRQLSRQDAIYWINLYGAAGLKRLRAVGPDRVLVKSDNPDIDDQEVAAEDLRIEGRAIWVARGL